MNSFELETETKEFKRSLAELKSGLKSLCAMLNKHGVGELWFGIASNSKVVGLDINEKTLRDVSQAISAHIEPAIYPSITLEIINEKPCLKVTVIGQQKPYFAYGNAYIRVADEDKRLSVIELKEFILHENRDSLRWETEVSNFTFDKLDLEKINKYLKSADLVADNPIAALENLGLLENGKLLKAAELFFTNRPIELRCAVFATTDTSAIIDMQDFYGDILMLIEEAEKYILKNIHIGMRLDGMYRVNVPEIPVESLREAVINAFCHRDWRDPDYIQIAIFKNRVEIRSPGVLYGDLTIDQIKKGNVSRRRNPLIADLLRRVNLIEAWGRGMSKILSNAPNTVFKEIAGMFVTVFERQLEDARFDDAVLKEEFIDNHNVFAGERIKAKEKSSESQRKVKEKPKKSQRKAKEKSKVNDTVLNVRDSIFHMLKLNPSHSVRTLADELNTTNDSVRYHLRRLQSSGKVYRVGSTKGGYWQVVND